jgi:hypothetical protein
MDMQYMQFDRFLGEVNMCREIPGRLEGIFGAVHCQEDIHDPLRVRVGRI